MTEGELKKKMIEYFNKYFIVDKEVWSDDMTSRIDIMLVEKDDEELKYPIGIEVKEDCKKRGKELAMWLRQSSRYSTKIFGKYGKVLVVTYPQVSGKYLNEGSSMNQHSPA